MAAEIKIEDWPDLVGKVLTLQVDIPKTEEGEDFTYYEVTGKCVAAGKLGFALTIKGHTRMFEAEDILDVEVVNPRKSPLVIRYIKGIYEGVIRQHLIDRHGLQFDAVRAMSASDAWKLHEHTDHDRLGHRHGDKPPPKNGRPRYERPVD